MNENNDDDDSDNDNYMQRPLQRRVPVVVAAAAASGPSLDDSNLVVKGSGRRKQALAKLFLWLVNASESVRNISSSLFTHTGNVDYIIQSSEFRVHMYCITEAVKTQSDHICSMCGRDCHFGIGLSSHARRCSRITNQSTTPLSFMTEGCQPVKT